MRTIDIAPTIAYLLKVPEPQQSQGRVLLDLQGGDRIKPSQWLVSTTSTASSTRLLTAWTVRTSRWAAPLLATMFDEEAALPGPALLLAAGDNVGASPANSGLLQDMPAIDVENAWGLQATSFGNHEFDYGVTRLQQHVARAHFPFMGVNIIDATTYKPRWDSRHAGV